MIVDRQTAGADLGNSRPFAKTCTLKVVLLVGIIAVISTIG